MEKVHDLYWFEENGVREIGRDSVGKGHDTNWILMQFTGLMDSKGNEIYEGDILKSGVEDCLFDVLFIPPAFVVKSRDDNSLIQFNYQWVELGQIYVAGNIHQEPNEN